MRLKNIPYVKLLLFMVTISILSFVIYVEYIYRTPIENDVYDEFLLKVKFSKHNEAYQLLCPLINQKDQYAMRLVSEAYLNGNMGLEQDLLKAKIWEERALIKSFDTGLYEYEKFNYYLNLKNYDEAALFLQQAANKGNIHAIGYIKNQEFILANHLPIGVDVQAKWAEFEYNSLYPLEDCINN